MTFAKPTDRSSAVTRAARIRRHHVRYKISVRSKYEMHASGKVTARYVLALFIIGSISLIYPYAVWARHGASNPILAQPVAAAQMKTKQLPSQPVIKTSVSHSLGITPRVYVHRLNDTLKDIGSSLRVTGNMTLNKGAANNIFTIDLSRHFTIQCSVDKASGKVIDLLITSDDPDVGAAMDLSPVMVKAAVSAAIPKVLGTKASSAIDDMVVENRASHSMATRQVENVKLQYNVIKSFGMITSVSGLEH